jgi:YgiT-type zinc finger domain-containing protein
MPSNARPDSPQAESEGRCLICKVGRLELGRTTVTLDDDQDLTVVIRHVPAEVCDCCGDAMVDEATARAVLTMAPRPPTSGVFVLNYAA